MVANNLRDNFTRTEDQSNIQVTFNYILTPISTFHNTFGKYDKELLWKEQTSRVLDMMLHRHRTPSLIHRQGGSLHLCRTRHQTACCGILFWWTEGESSGECILIWHCKTTHRLMTLPAAPPSWWCWWKPTSPAVRKGFLHFLSYIPVFIRVPVI